MKEADKRFITGLRPVVAPLSGKDVIINRPTRRAITGVAYNAQKCRLLPDTPDAAGNASFPCRIADVSDAGLGVVCRAVEQAPDLFPLGARMVLEASDGTRSRWEIRWIRHGRIGLKRVSAKS